MWLKGEAVWVIKLGGSLLGTDELQHWLRLVAQHGDGRVVIVPGGGVFADTVRTLYAQVPMSDSCAHELAVGAMNQLGTLLIDQMPELVPAHSELEIAERSWQHRGIVWMPSKMVMTDGDDIPHSWDVTSDSLALWLANKISAKHLLLIKSQRPQQTSTLDNLIADGLIDPAFPIFTHDSDVKSWVVYKHDYEVFLDGFGEAALAQVGHLLQ
jgi:aspartokinase-like uncharacterized kinase